MSCSSVDQSEKRDMSQILVKQNRNGLDIAGQEAGIDLDLMM